MWRARQGFDFFRVGTFSTAVAETTDTETLSHEGSSCILELADGRILRLTTGLEASCSTDRGLTWDGGPLQDGDEQIVWFPGHGHGVHSW